MRSDLRIIPLPSFESLNFPWPYPTPSVPERFDENARVPAGFRGVVTDKISGTHFFEILDADAITEAIGFNRAPLTIAFAFDVPKLKHVEEVVESHAVEFICVETLLYVTKFHRAHERFEGEAATIAATRTIGICFGDDHSFKPHVLRHAVVDVVFARLPTAVIRISAVERISRDYFHHVRIERAFSIIGNHLFARESFGQYFVHWRKTAFVHGIRTRRVGKTFGCFLGLVGGEDSLMAENSENCDSNEDGGRFNIGHEPMITLHESVSIVSSLYTFCDKHHYHLLIIKIIGKILS